MEDIGIVNAFPTEEYAAKIRKKHAFIIIGQYFIPQQLKIKYSCDLWCFQ